MYVQAIDAFIPRSAQRIAAYKMYLVLLDQRIANLLDSNIPWIVGIPDVTDNHGQPYPASTSDRYMSRIFAADNWIEN